MSNIPPYASPTLLTSRPPLSKAAVASLILGILSCIPLVTSITAVILAIVGFRATRHNQRRGRGFAGAGLTLGILGTLFWTATAAFTCFILIASQPARTTLHTFTRNIASGNFPAATADCDTTITPDQMKTVHDYMVPLGTYSDLTCTKVNMNASPTGQMCQFYGWAYFATGSHPFTATLRKTPSGAWKVYYFHIY